MDRKYKVIAMCGSTRFKDKFIEVQRRLTLEGNIVIPLIFFLNSEDEGVLTWEQIRLLSDMHKQKIDMADEIFVVNVNRYIGISTQNEIDYAISKGKTVRYLEEV